MSELDRHELHFEDDHDKKWHVSNPALNIFSVILYYLCIPVLALYSVVMIIKNKVGGDKDNDA